MNDLLFEHNIWDIIFDKKGNSINKDDMVLIDLKDKNIRARYVGLDENLNAHFSYKDRIIKIPKDKTNLYVLKEDNKIQSEEIISEIAKITLSDDALNVIEGGVTFMDLYEETSLLTTENYMKKIISNLSYLKQESEDKLQYEVSYILEEAINKLKKLK